MDANDDLRIAAIAAQQFGAFSAAQAAAAGFSSDDMRYRVRIGRWGRMHRGVFRIAGSQPTYEQVVMAGWLAAGGDAVVSHTTAAVLHGFPLRSDAVELTVVRQSRSTKAGLVVHRATTLTPADRTTIGPFVATSITRTLIDIAGATDDKRLIACVDFAVTSRATAVPFIRRRMEAVGRTGRGNIAALARILDARYPGGRAPESPLERRVVDLLAQLPGAPMTLQHWVQLPDGSWVRLDGAWPLEMVAVEVDSYRHHTSPDAWALDNAKRTVLTAMGWRILTFTHFDARRRPGWILQQVAAARGLDLAS